MSSHLLDSFLHRLQLTNQRSVQRQHVWAEARSLPRIFTFLLRPPEDGIVVLNPQKKTDFSINFARFSFALR